MTSDMTLRQAIELFKSDMRLRQLRPTTQARYGRELERFADHVGWGQGIVGLGREDARSYLSLFEHCEAATYNLEHTILSSFFGFLEMEDVIDASPMRKIRKAKTVPLKDRKRTRNSTSEIVTMLAACQSWPEELCLYTLALLGPRRSALAKARWGDVDGKAWTLTLDEKGGKRIAKPIPRDLRSVYLRYWMAHPDLQPEDWLVPNKRDTGHRDKRSCRIVYHLVKDVGRRTGIKTHVHSWRAAFAVRFLEENPGEIEALRALMGHSSIATTQGSYLSEFDEAKAMRRVETLSFTESVGERELSRHA